MVSVTLLHTNALPMPIHTYVRRGPTSHNHGGVGGGDPSTAMEVVTLQVLKLQAKGELTTNLTYLAVLRIEGPGLRRAGPLRPYHLQCLLLLHFLLMLIHVLALVIVRL
jgi:hypothetical protein